MSARGGRRAAAPRGTRDVLPAEARVRERVVDVARDAFARYGYGEIVTPTFEETEVFVRGVGTSTDVVRKEMYTFDDRAGRSLTLRPEDTAPVVRAFVQHGMHKLPLPVKPGTWRRCSATRPLRPAATASSGRSARRRSAATTRCWTPR